MRRAPTSSGVPRSARLPNRAAIGFLTALIAATSIHGVVLLLVHRGIGRYLIAFSSAVALLTFGALFVAEATPAWPVYLIPAALGLALHPDTGRWGRSG